MLTDSRGNFSSYGWLERNLTADAMPPTPPPEIFRGPFVAYRRHSRSETVVRGLWTTRRQTNSPTDQLANNPNRRQPTRRQTNSPTILTMSVNAMLCHILLRLI